MTDTPSKPDPKTPSRLVVGAIIVIGLALAGLFLFIGPLSLNLEAVYGDY